MLNDCLCDNQTTSALQLSQVTTSNSYFTDIEVQEAKQAIFVFTLVTLVIGLTLGIAAIYMPRKAHKLEGVKEIYGKVSEKVMSKIKA